MPVSFLLAMFVLLLSLIMMYVRLDVGRRDISKGEMLYVHMPLSVYLGWISVAPIANVAAALVSIGWGGFGLGETTWTALMIIVATLLTAAMIFLRGDTPFSLVIIWAVGGIMSKQASNQTLVTVSGAAILVIAGLLVVKKVFLKSEGLLYLTERKS